MNHTKTTNLPPIPRRLLPPQPPKRRRSLKELIRDLPYEIKFKIYKEYFEAVLYYELYKSLICHKKSKYLELSILRPYIPILLSKPNVIKYLCKQCPNFKESYYVHKILNSKNFLKLKNGESFGLGILMRMYH